ncbi:RHS domain-containing protein [Escherichia fergusonii]|nr:RHS domain-containing protein [Escherichia fergusonii]
MRHDQDGHSETCSYDALDRRTEKPAWRQGAEKPERTVFEWSGMRLCGEHNEKSPAAHTLYLYEENSYQPLARVDRYSGDNEPWQRVLYYHTLPNGYPQCMTDSDGGIVWRARVQLWGNIRFEENRDIYSVHPQQNLRFAGQYLDRETGLHYNTFRYFLPESGRFSQPDPISLEGGINLYQYALNPLGWIDPLGLARRPCETETFIRFMSDHEAARVQLANKLVVSVNRTTGEITNKPRWISLKGYERPGTSKLNTRKVTFTVKKGTTERLKQKSVSYDDIEGEGSAPNNVIIKGNEKNSFGIGKNILDLFNENIIGKVKVEKIK